MEIIVLSVDVQANNERQKKMTQLLNLIIFDKNRYHTFLSHEDNMKKKKNTKNQQNRQQNRKPKMFSGKTMNNFTSCMRTFNDSTNKLH